MAINFSTLMATAGNANVLSGSGTANIVLNTRTFTAGRTYVLFVSFGPTPDLTSVTAPGMSWTKIGVNQSFPSLASWVGAVWVGTCTATGTKSVTLGFAGNASGMETMIDEITGAHSTNPVRQFAQASATSVTLASTFASGSATYMVTGEDTPTNFVPEAGFTPITIGNFYWGCSAFNPSQDLTPSYTSSGTTWPIFALEITDATFVTTTVGPADGTTAATSGGTVSWATPTNGLTSDNVYTTHTTSTTAANMPYLNVTNFASAFADIPNDATVLGITATLERKYTGGTTGNVRDNTVQLMKAGTRVGTNKAVTATNWTTSDLVVSYGGAADLWGTTWTVSDLKNANFGVSVRAIGNGTSANRVANIDAVRISVSYSGGTPVTVVQSGPLANSTRSVQTAVGTATQAPPTVAGDVIALLHMNEASFDARPLGLVNSAPGGLSFTNQGSDNLGGGRFWFGGEGPFGQGFNAQGENGAGVAIVCDQTIDVSKGMTHEGFFMEFDADGRSLWELRENVAVNPAWWINVASIPQGSGTWTLQLDIKLPGYSQLTVQSSVFTSTSTGNGNWVVTQWNDDGTFDIYVQGNRVLHTTQTFDVALTAAKLAIFGSYRGTYAGGLYGKLIGEFRFSKVAQYTGSSLTVPTARFPDPVAGSAEVLSGPLANTTRSVGAVALVGSASGIVANSTRSIQAVALAGSASGTLANVTRSVQTISGETGTTVYGVLANTSRSVQDVAITGAGVLPALANSTRSMEAVALSGEAQGTASNVSRSVQTVALLGEGTLPSAANTTRGVQTLALAGEAFGSMANVTRSVQNIQGSTQNEVYATLANFSSSQQALTSLSGTGVLPAANNTTRSTQTVALAGEATATAANTTRGVQGVALEGTALGVLANVTRSIQEASGSANLGASIANVSRSQQTIMLTGVATGTLANVTHAVQAVALSGEAQGTASNTTRSVQTASVQGSASASMGNLTHSSQSASMEGEYAAMLANISQSAQAVSLIGEGFFVIANLSASQQSVLLEGVYDAILGNTTRSVQSVVGRISQIDPDRLRCRVEYEEWIQENGVAKLVTRTKTFDLEFASESHSGPIGVVSESHER